MANRFQKIFAQWLVPFLLIPLMTRSSFLQWNCRGLLSNLDDINALLDRHDTTCACLQETYLNERTGNPFRRYNVFRKDRADTTHASGGVAIITKKSIPSKPVSLATDLEAVAVEVCLDKVITVCSIYLPPSVVVEQRQFENLCNQLPPPFLLLGDLNAHSTFWGSTKVDHRGKMLERVLLTSSICLLNTGSPTYVNCATQTFSSIDLSFCSPCLYQDVDWKVDENPHGSDHFPVILKLGRNVNSLGTRPPRWKQLQADWSTFEKEANLASLSFEGMDVEQINSVVTDTIINAAVRSIPQTSGRLPRRPKPWWTAACETTRKEQNRAWGIFRRYPTSANLIVFKKARAKARWTQRQAKRESWRNFVSSLNNNAPSKVVWDRLRKIKGDYSAFCMPLLQVNGSLCQGLKEQANTLGEHFQNVSSSSHYSQDFLKVKGIAEKQNLIGHDSDHHTYNMLFNMTELLRALASTKLTAPGPDRITYSMLQHLSKDSLESLLHFFNTVWKEGRLPCRWKVATVIPLLKPGKDSSIPTSYRPIALTSCLGKTFERMVNNRLTHFLEENKCLSRYQCGFQMGRSTVDHLIRLETTIREAFLRR
uniref:RNA-directed DNA polymerase from transposon X-element n=1 Tax=Ornithodoros erraticus TaxID=265619 RepID=A0A293LMC9_ORNER